LAWAGAAQKESQWSRLLVGISQMNLHVSGYERIANDTYLTPQWGASLSHRLISPRPKITARWIFSANAKGCAGYDDVAPNGTAALEEGAGSAFISWVHAATAMGPNGL
jgi:hypothetical protein